MNRFYYSTIPDDLCMLYYFILKEHWKVSDVWITKQGTRCNVVLTWQDYRIHLGWQR